MTRTLVARYSGLLAIITAHIAVVPGLAFAQKFEYRDVIKTIEVKAPARRGNVEPKPVETKNLERNPVPAKAETKPTETNCVAPKRVNKEELPTADWLLLTRWHMSMEQVAASSQKITPTTASERRDYNNPNVGVALLKALNVEDEIQYTAFYWFQSNKLVAVVLKPGDFRHWSTVHAGLEQTYGTPSEDKSKTISSGAMQCVVTDKTWISGLDGNTIKFIAQQCNQNQHLNFYSVRYEPVLASMAASLNTSSFSLAGVR